MAKKITPKKRTPNPIVVLEEWGGGNDCPKRLVYDATKNEMRVEWFGGLSERWRDSALLGWLDYDLAGMP